MKTEVVPEPSERCTTVMAASGNFAFGLSFASVGSFHLVIFPRKIPASVSGESRSSEMLLTLYTTTTAPITVGMCWMPAARPISSALIGASLAPKSTVFSVICLMPPPEPIDW